eukprot:GHVO01040748.1.p1 GENE.GHVO01040748.1~~GHVO01040748.1.p1  ORF type:complete len:140 (-),score=26.12 GHVO01040748.1:212-631(-)
MARGTGMHLFNIILIFKLASAFQPSVAIMEGSTPKLDLRNLKGVKIKKEYSGPGYESSHRELLFTQKEALATLHDYLQDRRAEELIGSVGTEESNTESSEEDAESSEEDAESSEEDAESSEEDAESSEEGAESSEEGAE